MGLKLEQVIPWGRSFEEYLKMFDLTPTELQSSILDCAAGPASFNAEMHRRGYRVISCDPIYQFRPEEIAQQIQATYGTIVEGVRANSEGYVWREIASPDSLGSVRMAAMERFLADFPQGFDGGRYLAAELPNLPFDDGRFDLALCSHFLFTYSELFSEQFHLDAILELCRVAREVRIFPLLDVSGKSSPHLDGVMEELAKRGYELEIRSVEYEFQRGGDRLLQCKYSGVD